MSDPIMNDELRKLVKVAADRLRQMRRDSEERDGGYPATEEGRLQSVLDHAALAEAYLAEYPADDDLPVTEEWLRSVGFVDRGDDGYTLVLRERDSDGEFSHSLECADPSNLPGCPWELWNLHGDKSPQEQDDSVMLPIRPETRGDVRRLVEAFWMTLKE